MRSTRFTLSLLAALALVACGGDDDGTASDPTQPADVTLPAPDGDTPSDGTSIDGAWLLVSGSVDGTPVALVDGWPVTLVVEGTRIGGTAACNGYGGTVDTADGAFVVGDLGWTEMGCEPAVMELEQAFLQSLGAITTHVVDGDTLTIAGPAAEWVFAREAPVPETEIVGTTWVLDTYLDGDAATNMPFMELATLTLSDDGTFVGSTSCRRLEGEWITAGVTIQFTSFAAIEDPLAGACAPESEALDGLIISVLESGVTVELDGNRLTFMAPGNEGLSYTAVAPSVEIGGDDGAAPDPEGGVDGPVAYAAHDSSAPSDRQTSATVMAALIEGVLELDGDCLYATRENGRFPVLWPFGTTWQADPPAVILPNGDLVVIGGELSGGGGYLDAEALGRLTGNEPALDLLVRCAERPSYEVGVLQAY